LFGEAPIVGKPADIPLRFDEEAQWEGPKKLNEKNVTQENSEYAPPDVHPESNKAKRSKKEVAPQIDLSDNEEASSKNVVMPEEQIKNNFIEETVNPNTLTTEQIIVQPYTTEDEE
jgi:hypothetical protein